MGYAINLVDRTKPEVLRILKKLHNSCLPGDKPYEFKDGYWWLVTYKGVAVGFCGMEASSRWEKTGYFCRAGVAKEHRGRGLHNRLIQVRLRYARRLGWTHCVSDTRDNPPSANNLIKAGFKMYQPRYPWGWDDACYWIKKL